MNTFLDRLQSLPEKVRFLMASSIFVMFAIAIFYAWSHKTSSELFKISDTAEPVPAAFLNTAAPPNTPLPGTGVYNNKEITEPVGILPQIKNGLKDMASLIMVGVEGLAKKINP